MNLLVTGFFKRALGSFLWDPNAPSSKSSEPSLVHGGKEAALLSQPRPKSGMWT